MTTGTVTVNVCGRIHTFKRHRQYVTTGTVTVHVCGGIHRKSSLKVNISCGCSAMRN